MYLGKEAETFIKYIFSKKIPEAREILVATESIQKFFGAVLDRLLELSFYHTIKDADILSFFDEETAKDLLSLKPNLEAVIDFLALALTKNPDRNTSVFGDYILVNLSSLVSKKD
ncbi:DNA polymerase III subunits gamma and tau [Candidatus Mycoplasma haematolamae str. Purdue]|uniref:DNA polymerase III subunits gamma and tau n=1 Tax=Mycoplasma haematolamae (strain Purdue) TaxID=1212765 RepID=I7C6E6_MYCHA|nr:hypothetical protein [Candidatus Mycoplasma haematolamae]AFO52077.1 DNA polymerase III subunits gamma and tau [Candidatus Mycoplasma haematolamae str. Purdue]